MSRPYPTVALFAAASALSSVIACSVSAPLTPAPPPGTAGTTADGSTLKVGAPTLVSPINDVVLNTQKPTLSITAVKAGFAPNTQFTYEFELQTDQGTVVFRGTNPSTDVTVPDNLNINAAYKWRARATLNGAAGPFSALSRFQTPKFTIPTAASGDNEWKTWFFGIIDLRGVGPIASAAALTALIPDFNAAGVLLETNSAGQPRGRIYLPTGNPNNKFGRSVDIGSFGGPWQWFPRGGTTCEGGSCIQ